jgi:ArsR family transcriptional regulator
MTELVPLFQALGDPTRLRILNLLAAGELCVCYFVEILGDPQPKVSRHLAYLRHAGVVDARRDGKWIHYRLARPADETVARVLDAALAAVAGDRQMKRDRLALERACCAPALQHAPKPHLDARG